MLSSLKSKVFKMIYQLLRFQNYIPETSDVVIHPSAKVSGCRLDGRIRIEENARISRTELYGDIEIGRYSSINGPNVDLYAGKGKIRIGKFCSIARNVSFQLANHSIDYLTTYNIYKNIFKEEAGFEENSKGDIVIGHDVWIGAHVVILPGANIGHGAVVAANAVVNSKVPPFSVVGGTPAKIIKYRFDPETIDGILKLKWWDWDIDQIKKKADLFAKPINGNLDVGLNHGSTT